MAAGKFGKKISSIFDNAINYQKANIANSERVLKLGQKVVGDRVQANKLGNVFKGLGDISNKSRDDLTKALVGNADFADIAKSAGGAVDDLVDFATHNSDILQKAGLDGADIDLSKVQKDLGIENSLKSLAKKSEKLTSATSKDGNIISRGISAVTGGEGGALDTAKDFFMASDRGDLIGDDLLKERAKRIAGGIVVANGAKDAIDFMTGQREGLLQEQGRQDTAFIPFV